MTWPMPGEAGRGFKQGPTPVWATAWRVVVHGPAGGAVCCALPVGHWALENQVPLGCPLCSLQDHVVYQHPGAGPTG